MKGKLQIALGIVVMGACMARAEAGDDWIKDMVIVSGQFIHGGEPARRMFENAELVGTGPRRYDCFWAFKSVAGERLGKPVRNDRAIYGIILYLRGA